MPASRAPRILTDVRSLPWNLLGLFLLISLSSLACTEDPTLPTTESRPMLTGGTTLFSEGFESGVLSVNTPPCGQSSPDGGVWDGPPNRCRMELVNSESTCHTGNWCVHNDVVGDTTAGNGGGSFMFSPVWSTQRTVYVKFWQKWRSDFPFSGLGKILFLPGGAPNGQDNLYLRWDAVDASTAKIGINAVTSGGIDAYLSPNLTAGTITPGGWHEIQWRVTLRSSSSACDGATDVWIDDVHTLQYTGLCGLDLTGGIRALEVSGYYNDSVPMTSTYWIDDIVASDSFIQ
jgi:hypothetical protein